MPKLQPKAGRKAASSPKLHLKKKIILGRSKSIPTLEARCRALIDNMDLAAWMGDKDERTIYANQKFCELIECPLEEMIGKSSYGFWTPESAKKVRHVNATDRKKGINSSYEGELITRSGKIIPVRLNGTPLPDGATVGIMEDLREIRKKDEEIKRLFHDLVEGSPIATFVVNMDHKVVYWNKEMENGAVFVNFNPVQDLSWTFEPNMKYVRRYRLFIYDGAIVAQQAEELWREYAQE